MSRNDILENLKTSLEAINGTGSYTNTVAFVKRGYEGSVGADQYPYILIINPVESVKTEDYTSKNCLAEVEVDIFARCKDMTASELETFLSEIIKAVIADPHRGGYALNTFFKGCGTMDSDVPENQYIMTNFVITFRRSLGG